ncbi:hypothetical protein FACS1894211_08610 [Clostridia bacterium]|nr:hypothetical protein FACS1894211_08610 [Clostridia bacterium]
MNIFKNAFKIVGAKFPIVWSIILYYLIAGVIITSVGLSILLPYVNALVDFKVTEAVLQILKDLSRGEFSVFFTGAHSLWKELVGGLQPHRFEASLLLLAVFMIGRFLFGWADLAFYDMIHLHLSSAAKLGFMPCFIKRIGPAALYQLNKLVFSLPFDIAVFAVLYLISLLTAVAALVIFVPFIMMLAAVLLFSLRIAFLSGWAPALLEHQKSVSASFGISVKRLRGNFRRDYVVYLLFFLAAIVFNVFFGLFTLLVGLVLTIPLTLFFLKVLNCVVFRQNSGLRYYIDKDNVVNG